MVPTTASISRALTLTTFSPAGGHQPRHTGDLAVYCLCLRSFSQRAWGSAPHLPTCERMRDLESDGRGDKSRTWGPGRGPSGTVPWKCQESQAELPGLFLPGANCLILQCSTPNKPKVSSIFRGASLACVSPEGQGRRGIRKQAGSNGPKYSRTAKEPEPRWTQPGISPRHQSSRPFSLSCWNLTLLLLVTLVA